MPIKIDYIRANALLLEALSIAREGSGLPVEWVSHSRAIFELESKTWTPALATLLLAKATDSRVDTLSIKAEEASDTAYSMRGLGHKVVVPAALEYQFSIRNTGREPLNNQPFFRYDRIDRIDRVRNPEELGYFTNIARKANLLTENEAKFALSAFLRVALDVSARSRKIRVQAGGLTPVRARIAVENFLRQDAADRPQRLQAFAAACLDLLFREVRTRRINDPSRDLPGDVHAVEGSVEILAMEVRGKIVSQADLSSFAHSCAEAGLHRAVMFVDATHQPPLNARVLSREAGLEEMQVEAFECAADLLLAGLLWSHEAQEKSISVFAEAMLVRLKEIEASVPTLEEWARAVSVAGSR